MIVWAVSCGSISATRYHRSNRETSATRSAWLFDLRSVPPLAVMSKGSMRPNRAVLIGTELGL